MEAYRKESEIVDADTQTKSLLHRFTTDELYFMQTFLRVIDGEGNLVPFRTANRPMQQDFVKRVVDKKVSKAIELKARRVGGTTLFMNLGLTRCHIRKNYSVLLLAQSDPDSRVFMKEGFRKTYENMVEKTQMPDGSLFVPKLDLGIDSDHELTFPKTGGRIVVGTAGSIKFGRGQGFDMVIGTEAARWDVNRPPGTAEETWAMAVGAQQDKADPFAVLESTAYGAGGYFYETYGKAKRGENGYLALFYDWRWHPAYQYEEDDPRALRADRNTIELIEDEIALGLTKPQARWRRALIAELGVQLFQQEFPEDDEVCFRMSGDPYFDADLVDRRILECRPILSSSESGQLRVWQSPRIGEKYIISADPCGSGVERRFASQEPDFAAVGVYDTRLNHVATLHGRWDTHTLGGMVCDLCRYYNDGLFIGEAGPYGDELINVVSLVLGYKNIYYERDERGKVTRAGKLTTEASKPAMLDNLKDVIEHGIMRSDDKKYWEEMRNYHRVPTAAGRIKLEARAGHDDLVMMSALAAWAWREGNFGRRSRYGTRIHIDGKTPTKRRSVERSPFGDSQKKQLLGSLEARSG